jgi:hypothetical protein
MKHNTSHPSSSAEIFSKVTSQCSGEGAILAGHARLTQGDHWTCRMRSHTSSSAEHSKDVLRLRVAKAAILGGLHAGDVFCCGSVWLNGAARWRSAWQWVRNVFRSMSDGAVNGQTQCYV